jgi:hypothetical protein
MRVAPSTLARGPDLGLFVDQKWVDLVPGLFAPVAVLTDPGLNVAYWNLAARPVRRDGARWTAGGAPLRFVHYSGYDPAYPAEVSKHQTRLAMSDVGPAAALFDAYRERLLAEGWRACSRWPYSWAPSTTARPSRPSCATSI